MKEMSRKRLGELLIEDGVLTKENLYEALENQKKHGGLIGQVLITLGYISEEDLIAALCRQLNLPYLPIGNYSVDFEVTRRFSEELCRRHMFVAIDEDDEHIYLAMADPLNASAVEEIKKKVDKKVQIYVSMSSEIMQTMDLAFNLGSDKKKTGA